MSSERIEWVEIIEPRTKERMYANLSSGECVWDPPEGVNIKRTDASQWWELFDTNTQRFYYYNVASQSTVWHRPINCDIIPLAKLQTLKQNTDPNDRKDGSTQTATKQSSLRSHRGDVKDAHNRQNVSSHSRILSAGTEARCGDILSSPSGRHSYRLPTAAPPPIVGRSESHRYCRHSQGGSSSRSNKAHLDSGKSSDSSLSSTHGYRRLQDGGSLRIGSQQRNKHGPDNSYRMLQESSSSHNIPHVSLPSDSKHAHNFPMQVLPCSVSNSSDLCGISPTHGTSTPPVIKKKLPSENAIHSKRESCGSVSKHQSFDYVGSKDPQMVSLTRSGSFMSSSSPRQQPFTRKTSIDGNGGGMSDDSMHEKYFKSVENTPETRRRNTSSVSSNPKHSSDSSPQSPISPQTNSVKATRPSILSSLAFIETPNSYLSSHKTDPVLLNLDLTAKPERYLDKMKVDKTKISPGSAVNSTAVISMQQINNLLKSKNISPSSQNEYNSNSARRSPSIREESYLNKPNLERHSKEFKSDKKTSTHKSKKKSQMMGSDVEYDNGNISPLYSNWDQEHLLPLQHYIIEQAKLSGCYRLSGDPLDSDSLHSDSQSEHSFSGHEPDNEDSDHSDGRGDYLTHHYGMEDYGAHCGVSYYNLDIGFDKSDKEDISEEVEAKLENEGGEIYSPVKNHQFFQKPMVQNQSKQVPQRQTAAPEHQTPKSQPHRSHHEQQPPQKLQQKQQHNQSLPSVLKMPPSIGVDGPPPNQLAIMKECDIEKFAQDNLNLHSKGIFRKKSSVRDMLSWTADAISRPMLALSRDKAGKKMATEMFKLIQIYMGDRKARAGMSLNSVILDIITMAVAQPQLRDEMYVQLCRQTTENHMRESLIRGWELMAICLSFIPPSPTFQPALLNYMNRHRDPTFATSFPEVGKWPIHVQVSHYATIACRRLDRIGSGGKKQAKKPTDDEINQARDQIFHQSMFGNTLDEVMELQKDRFPDRKLPWVQVTLSEQVLLLSGKSTEGIFRVSADVDEVNWLKSRLDRWDVPEHKSTMDAHAPASLLKLWYRELYDPLIPDELYDECVATEDPDEVNAIINKLPRLNKLVLTFLVHYLQQFSQPDIVACTKMDSSNLAMVFAPNCLRCTSHDPKVILENARKEMAFMRTLITNMDTSSVSNLV